MIWSPYSSSCQCGGVGGADGWVWGWAAVVLLAVSGSATFACCRHPWRVLVRVFVRSLYVQGTAWGSDSLLRQLLCLSGWLVGWLAGWLVGCPLTPGDESTLKRLLTQTLSLQIEQHLQQMVLLFQPRRSCFGCFGPCTCRVVDPANVCEQGTCRAQYPSAAC